MNFKYLWLVFTLQAASAGCNPPCDFLAAFNWHTGFRYQTRAVAVYNATPWLVEIGASAAFFVRAGKTRDRPRNVTSDLKPEHVSSRLETMMGSILIILILTQLTSQIQGSPGVADDPHLAVIKFSWIRYPVTQSELIAGNGQPRKPDEPPLRGMPPLKRPTAEQIPVGNTTQTVDEASAALRRVEAADAQRTRPQDGYLYRVTVKNTGERTIRGLYWEYRSQQSERPDDFSRRQFFCSANVGPEKTKAFEAFSPSAPTRVLNASRPGDDTQRQYEKVVVNRIEYSDGSIWQHPDWKMLQGTSPESARKQSRRVPDGCYEIQSAKP